MGLPSLPLAASPQAVRSVGWASRVCPWQGRRQKPIVCPTLLLVAQVLLQLFHLALDLVGGILNLVGIVDDARREENHQLGTSLAALLPTECGAYNWDLMQHRNASRVVGLGLLDETPDRDGFAILHGYLRGERALRKRGRIDAARRVPLRLTDFLFDLHGDDTARIHAGQNIK